MEVRAGWLPAPIRRLPHTVTTQLPPKLTANRAGHNDYSTNIVSRWTIPRPCRYVASTERRSRTIAHVTSHAGSQDRGATRPEPRLTIKDLISYRLHRVANALSRGAALRYRHDFDVSLGEWRALALLGAKSPQSLKDLSLAAGLDKAQMSRVVTSLVDRGYVYREAEPGARRMVRLELTEAGDDLFRRLIDTAATRNDAYLACLTPEELAALDSILHKLGERARLMAEEDAEEPRERN